LRTLHWRSLRGFNPGQSVPSFHRPPATEGVLMKPLLAVLVTVAFSCSFAARAGNLLDIDVIDRDTGSTLPTHMHAGKLYVGNSKGMGSYSDIWGPHSPLPKGPEGAGSVKSLQKGSVEIVDVSQLKTNLRAWTKQVYDNTPYHDEQLVTAKAPAAPTVIPPHLIRPRKFGAAENPRGSPPREGSPRQQRTRPSV